MRRQSLPAAAAAPRGSDDKDKGGAAPLQPGSLLGSSTPRREASATKVASPPSRTHMPRATSVKIVEDSSAISPQAGKSRMPLHTTSSGTGHRHEAAPATANFAVDCRESPERGGKAAMGTEASPPLQPSAHSSALFAENETKYFKKMFDMFDTDHSGAIGFFEMKNLTRHLGVQLSDDALRSSIRAVDSNGNGELEFTEFLQWLSNVNDNVDGCGDEFAVLKSKIRAQGARPLSSNQIEQFRQVFKHFDVDGSGTIDVEELGNVFEAMGQHLSHEELQSVLQQADEDGSGEIDFDEFLMLMCCSFGAEKSFESDLMEAFRRYDTDSDGLISTRELRQLVHELVGDTMSAAEVEEVVEVAALDRGDGTIDYMKWESLWDACRGGVL